MEDFWFFVWTFFTFSKVEHCNIPWLCFLTADWKHLNNSCSQSYYIEVAQGGIFSRAIHNSGLSPGGVAIFDRSANPISTRGAVYAHHSTTSHPGFSDLATGLQLIVNV